MAKLVSIIIPAYNSEKYISETISSVLNQTYSNFELIIINDGSTDNTKDLIEVFSKQDNRIKVVNKENSGVSDSRNIGLKVSTGDYVSFLDSDDIWLQNNLEQKINALTTTNIDGVYSFCEIIDGKSKKTGVIKIGQHLFTLDNILLWEGNYITIPSGLIFKKSIIQSINGFNINLSNNADQDLLIRLLAKNYKIGLINEVTWLYRKHSNNMSSNIPLMEKDTIAVYKMAEENNLFKNKSFKNKCFSKVYVLLSGSWHHEGKNNYLAFKRLLKAFEYSPLYTIKLLLKKA